MYDYFLMQCQIKVKNLNKRLTFLTSYIYQIIFVLRYKAIQVHFERNVFAFKRTVRTKTVYVNIHVESEK